jgi:3-hydroxyisobutyrate dehydrogenase-like beta-hydroxyacid dehydrogenase
VHRLSLVQVNTGSHIFKWLIVQVFGAPAMAEAGQLVTVLAGPKALVEKVKPFTKNVIAKADIDLSDKSPGQATLLKVIGNTFVLQMVEALGEGHVLAEKSGLGSEALHDFISTMFPGPYAAYSTRMVSGDYYSREYVSSRYYI